jgi:hypothetical protein
MVKRHPKNPIQSLSGRKENAKLKYNHLMVHNECRCRLFLLNSSRKLQYLSDELQTRRCDFIKKKSGPFKFRWSTSPPWAPWIWAPAAGRQVAPAVAAPRRYLPAAAARRQRLPFGCCPATAARRPATDAQRVPVGEGGWLGGFHATRFAVSGPASWLRRRLPRVCRNESVRGRGAGEDRRRRARQRQTTGLPASGICV